MEHIPIMDLGFKFNGIIKAPYKALKIFLRVGGGGYKNHVRSRQPRLKRNSLDNL